MDRQTAFKIHNRQPGDKLLFLPGLFNETLGMLFDAHHYFQARAHEDLANLPTELNAKYTNEMTRVTMRLTSTMAWLMVRRAVFAGRVVDSPEYAKLDGEHICLIHDKELAEQLPYYMNYLMERSHDLYARVHRIAGLAS